MSSFLSVCAHTHANKYSPENFVNETLQHHLEVMWEMVQRDGNRPAVVMWSLANEPSSNDASSGDYFKSVAEWTRSLDPTRPITFVTDQQPGTDHAVSQFISSTVFCSRSTLDLMPVPFRFCLALPCNMCNSVCVGKIMLPSPILEYPCKSNCTTYTTRAHTSCTGPVYGHGGGELLLWVVRVSGLPRHHPLRPQLLPGEMEPVLREAFLCLRVWSWGRQWHTHGQQHTQYLLYVLLVCYAHTLLYRTHQLYFQKTIRYIYRELCTECLYTVIHST